MGHYHRRGIHRQRRLHHLADTDLCGVDTALADDPAAQGHPLGIQTQKHHRFVTAIQEPVHEIFSAVLKGIQLYIKVLLSNDVFHRDPLDQSQQDRNMLTHALDLHELLRRSHQNLIQTSEMVQQIVCQIVRVLSGLAVKQQHLQGMKFAEMIQTFPQEAFFHPLSVFFMVSHKAPLSTCIFLKILYNKAIVEITRTHWVRKDGSMEQIEQLLALMDRPAFCAENGRITAVNTAARSLALSTGMPVSKLLSTGQDAYAEFESGCLTLDLSLAGGIVNASVTALDQGHLFTLEPEGTEEDLRMLALAAQVLRGPLADVMALAEELPPETSQRTGIHQGLHRLLRIIGNMTPPPVFRPEMTDLNATLKEIWEQAQPACEAKGFDFTFTPNPAPVFTAADGPMLARVIHNLLSNSMKFSPAGQLRLELLRSGSICRIRFWDAGGTLPPDPFSRYLRDPGLEDPRSGLGMGMRLVRTAATAHRGTALMTVPKQGGVLTELRLPLEQNIPLRSPLLRISYTGEWDPLLVELSDVLPPEFYE